MPAVSELMPFAGLGIVVGLVLLWRGFGGSRAAARIAGTSTSRIASIAAGEVRISGPAEAAEVLLVSALQSKPCVYYRAQVGGGGDAVGSGELEEERAVGFVVGDTSGAIRVFPQGATWDVPWRFDESEDWAGRPPTGLVRRTGSPYTAAREDREAQIAALLTVRDDPNGPAAWRSGRTSLGLAGQVVGFDAGERRRRRYSEARIEPGDTVTILGRAVPFGSLADPAHADLSLTGRLHDLVEEEIAADIAEARAAGILAPDAEAAWGNAAIPGFGIGRPVREPVIDHGADRAPLAEADEAAATRRTFTIAPEALVIVGSVDVPLLVSAGPPGVAAERQKDRFLVGLLGATLAIGSAVVLALGVAATLA